jgi:hypothetical protein
VERKDLQWQAPGFQQWRMTLARYLDGPNIRMTRRHLIDRGPAEHPRMLATDYQEGHLSQGAEGSQSSGSG